MDRVVIAAEPSVYGRGDETQASGVSWGAVAGGAVAIAALYLILLALGAGFGLSAVSPWDSSGLSASSVNALAIGWLVFIEIIASALGGYLTGRLRTKWSAVHDDEIYFRDTANGFLAWALALVVTATFLASAGTSMAGREPAWAAASAAGASRAYFADTLFRSDRGTPTGDPGNVTQAEAERVLSYAVIHNSLPEPDRDYLRQLIVARVGVSASDADARISFTFARAQQAEEEVRKATAHFLLWLFLSLLMGAFSASVAATIGGRQRINSELRA
jgi:hypothetical protein